MAFVAADRIELEREPERGAVVGGLLHGFHALDDQRPPSRARRAEVELPVAPAVLLRLEPDELRVDGEAHLVELEARVERFDWRAIE